MISNLVDGENVSPSTVSEPTVETLRNALETAKAAAQAAGDYLQDNCGNAHVLKKKALRDGLLDVDLEAETIIKEKLQQDFPDFGIFSEEAGENKNTPCMWVVDPLDGSFNFQHGNPTFAISISLIVNTETITETIIETVLGVIYIPFLHETFTVIRKQGAWLNGRPIHISPTADLNDAIVHVGDFAKDGNLQENQEQLENMAQLANAVGRIRMIGTAATDLAYVACGRADALVIHNALPWDFEVGCLLIKEAGGKIEKFPDAPGKYLLVCSNANIHKALFRVLRSTKTITFEQKKRQVVYISLALPLKQLIHSLVKAASHIGRMFMPELLF